jgi:hypothetical protein
MLMPEVVAEDEFRLLRDGRLHLTNLDIVLTATPKQYCIEEVLDGGEFPDSIL